LLKIKMSYGSLNNYNSMPLSSACTSRYIVPSFGTPPGYTTGYCKSWATCPCTNGVHTGTLGLNVSTGGYQSLSRAYPEGCPGACGSQYVQKLCGSGCGM
jgi:hypothetical protein